MAGGRARARRARGAAEHACAAHDSTRERLTRAADDRLIVERRRILVYLEPLVSGATDALVAADATAIVASRELLSLVCISASPFVVVARGRRRSADVKNATLVAFGAHAARDGELPAALSSTFGASMRDVPLLDTQIVAAFETALGANAITAGCFPCAWLPSPTPPQAPARCRSSPRARSQSYCVFSRLSSIRDGLCVPPPPDDSPSTL